MRLMPEEDSPKSPDEIGAAEKALGLKLAEQYFETKIAHNAACLHEHLRQNRIVERLAQRTQDAAFGETDSTPALEGEDMGVNVGNTITNYYGQKDEKTVEPGESEKIKASLRSKLGTAALVSALVLGSGGLGAGALALLQLANQELAAEGPTNVDTDTQYELRIGGVN
jgi:hypothetical protein